MVKEAMDSVMDGGEEELEDGDGGEEQERDEDE